MGFKELLQKLKDKATIENNKNNKKNSKNKDTDSNRFLKFYHNHKGRLLKERKSLYYEKKKQGICVRCNKKALQDIVFCEFHQQKQVGYNQQSRAK